jgi:integrase
MGLYLRGSVWWMSFIDPNTGKQVRRSTETEAEKQAKRIFDKIRGQIAEGKWFERLLGEDYTFKELMEKYLEDYALRNKAANSYKRDCSSLKNLTPYFGSYPVTEVNPRAISAYKTYRRTQGAAPRTVNIELTLMSHAYEIAIREWEWIKDNPVKRVVKEKVRNYIERWLTHEDEEKLLKASPDWLQDIIVFAVNTGFRESEILGLKWSQIDLTRRTLTISEQKNQGVDTLPLNQTVLRLLRKRAMDSGMRDYVFPNEKGNRIDNRNLLRAFYKAMERSGIENFRFHDLRHTFATRLVQSGVDLYAVLKLGRWRNTSMIMRYAHHYSESLRPSIEAIDPVGKPKVITNLAQLPKKRGYKPQLRLVTP